MAGDAPRDDFRLLLTPPRLGLGDGESDTFFDLTNSLLDSLFALGDAECVLGGGGGGVGDRGGGGGGGGVEGGGGMELSPEGELPKSPGSLRIR